MQIYGDFNSWVQVSVCIFPSCQPELKIIIAWYKSSDALFKWNIFYAINPYTLLTKNIFHLTLWVTFIIDNVPFISVLHVDIIFIQIVTKLCILSSAYAIQLCNHKLPSCHQSCLLVSISILRSVYAIHSCNYGLHYIISHVCICNGVETEKQIQPLYYVMPHIINVNNDNIFYWWIIHHLHIYSSMMFLSISSFL